MNDASQPNTGAVYVLGCGAVGLALAAALSAAGKNVCAVRTSRADVPPGESVIHMADAVTEWRETVPMVSLSRLPALSGLAVITAKSYVNRSLATALQELKFSGPVVLLQNGLGVEAPFLERPFPEIYRGVLYVTAQKTAEFEVAFRSIASCPLGNVRGSDRGLEACQSRLTTRRFPFHATTDIQREIWKKVIINSVFNSICPLLETDNGIFVRDPVVADLAATLVAEGVELANASGISLVAAELLEQIRRISQGSAGVLISTLQDLRNGRETEIESLNLEMARMAAARQPRIPLPLTEFLGRMILAKARLVIHEQGAAHARGCAAS